MNKTKLWMLAAILTICGTAAFASCATNDDNPAGQEAGSQYIPPAPDYADATMWITEDGDADGTGADVFYVVSTWEDDWTTADGKVCHYADVWNPEHRAHMADLEMKKVAAYMSPGNRFFAPFYRHTTIQAFMTNSEDTVYQRTRLAMDDVRTAFDLFQAQRDQSRPLIIAGFSQGGKRPYLKSQDGRKLKVVKMLDNEQMYVGIFNRIQNQLLKQYTSGGDLQSVYLDNEQYIMELN